MEELIHQVTGIRREISIKDLAKGWFQLIHPEIEPTIPKWEEREIELRCFFSTVDQAKDKYSKLGLMPDPLAQVAYSIKMPELTQEHPNGAVWPLGEEETAGLFLYKLGNIFIVECCKLPSLHIPKGARLMFCGRPN